MDKGLRNPTIPLIPGYIFDTERVGKTNFAKSHHFEYFDGVNALLPKEVDLAERRAHSRARRSPTVTAQGDIVTVPSWIAYDKQILRFDAYFKDLIHSVQGYDHVIRKVKILFYLEDASIKVVEPKVDNSGIAQGCLIGRQRIKLPDSIDFYDVTDFNIGESVVLYGRTFHIVDCDTFTRNFLRRLGIRVAEPLSMPSDPYLEIRNESNKIKSSRDLSPRDERFKKFIEYDKKILRFKGYWDDRSSQYGYLHLLQVRYFLSDDTLEVVEMPEYADEIGRYTLLKKIKLPKGSVSPHLPGQTDEHTVLNLAADFSSMLTDPLNCGRSQITYYTDKDLRLGESINVGGRKVVLYDCDEFTRTYYKLKYDIDYHPFPRPKTDYELSEDSLISINNKLRQLPPYNGFGTFEDSAVNCNILDPLLNPPVQSMRQFLQESGQGLDCRILRFNARRVSDQDDSKEFEFEYVISCYMADNTISVYKSSGQNSGCGSGMIIGKRKLLKPNQSMRTINTYPEYYTYEDLYVGAQVEMDRFKFKIIGCDEYTLKFMENFPHRFPKANIGLILDKLRLRLQDNYKMFVSQYMKQARLDPVPYAEFSSAIHKVLGEDIKEQEVLHLGRRFQKVDPQFEINQEELRSLVQTNLRRKLFFEFSKLEENYHKYDVDKSGMVKKKEFMYVLKGARLPLSRDLVCALEQSFAPHEESIVNYTEFIKFLNYKKYPAPECPPMNTMMYMQGNTRRSDLTRSKLSNIQVDVAEFIKALGMEEQFIRENS
uniref:EF-hand domain-containing family member C2 n=6 Tax=Cacopsylla melanoneura TaxID=428564 RepID=A0A8D9ELT9_9HEMI